MPTKTLSFNKARTTLVCGIVFFAVYSVLLFTPTKATAEGTHFLLEVNNGVSFPLGYSEESDPGYAFELTAGFGGRFPGNPIRFYLIGQFDISSFSGDLSQEACDCRIRAYFVDINGALRMLIPINKVFRIFADFGVGIANIQYELERLNIPNLHDDSTHFALFMGGGLQFRPFRFFSVGLKADFGFLLDEDQPSTLTDSYSSFSKPSGRLNIVGTLTLHF